MQLKLKVAACCATLGGHICCVTGKGACIACVGLILARLLGYATCGTLGGAQSACCVCKALPHQCTAAAWLDSYLVFYAATVALLWLNDDRATQVRTADPKASPCAGLSGKTCGVLVLSRCAGACSLPSSIRAECAVLARCLCSPLLQQTPTRTLLYLLSHVAVDQRSTSQYWGTRGYGRLWWWLCMLEQ